MDSLPRTGIPGYFSSYHDYRSYVDTLLRTNSIPDARRIMYDIVPHYRFPTLVIRICDMMPYYRDVLAVTALLQAAVAWMVDLRQRNMSFRNYERISDCREQVACAALRAGRQPDRLWHRAVAAGARR